MSSLSFHDIGLKPSVLRAAEKKAREEGKSAEEYLRSLVERDLPAGKTFDEILKPVRAGFKESGMSASGIDALVAGARKKIHTNRRRARR